nr:hypothetical protein [Tanacetum cinerariifolium]
MRADRFWKKTSKKITIQGSDVAGFDKSKVECFNCHKMGHFARECRSPRSQDRGKRERERYKKDPKVEDPAPKAMVAVDDKDMKGVGFNEYCAIPPPPAQVYSPPKKDLSWMGLPEFVGDNVTDYTRPIPSIDVPKSVTKGQEERWKSNQPSFFKQGGSSVNVVTNPMIKFVKEFGCPNATKVNNTENVRKPTVIYAEIFDHLEFNCNHDTWMDKGKTLTRVNHAQDNMKYTSTHKSMTPRAFLLKSGTKPINIPFSTARPTLKSAQPKMTSFVKTAHSNVKRPFERKSIAKNKVWSPTVRPKIPTVGSKVPTAKPVVAADKGNKGKAVKASACNISYLSEYEPFNGGYVSFGHERGKISGKGSIKTVVTDDFSRFSWTFFLKSKDETSRILRNFITEMENLKDLKVKIIRSDNEGEFRNKEMDEFYSRKCIKREFSNVRTPHQNGVAKRRNRTLIEAARTMVLLTKPYKTPYELFNERSPAIGFLRPFGCHVMILNTLDHLGKFDAKGDEGYFVGYSISSKTFRVFNKRTKKIEENLHVDFLENKSIEKGTGLDWLFDINTLTDSMNYVSVVVAGTTSTNISDTKEDVAKKDDAIPDNNFSQKEQQEVNGDKEVPKNSQNSNPTASSKVFANDSFELASGSTVETEVPTVSSPVPTDSLYVPLVTSISLNEVEANLSNMENAIQVSSTLTLKIHKDHLKSQIIGPVDTPVQTRHKTKDVDEQSFIAIIHQKTNPDLLQSICDAAPGFQDPEFPHRVYNVEKAMYGLHQALRAWYDIRETKTPMDRENPWGKDGTGKHVELYLYRSMIGSLMYLNASRPDIMFVVCACARYQMTPKECHLHAVKRIFRYLKGNLKLGLWYPKESLLDLVAYSDSDYGGANQDRKSTTREHNTEFHQIVDFFEASHIRRITRGTIRISQSKVPSPEADKTAFPLGYVRYGEAFPTDTSLDAGQDRENIGKTSSMPYEALPRVTSLSGGEGSSLGAVNILASGGLRSVFTTASLSVATASIVISLVVATASGSFPTTTIFTTASVATPTTRVTRSSRGVVIGSSSPISVNIPFISKRDKGKGKMTEPEQPNQILREQAKRDSEIARIHAERELEVMIAQLDRSNEMDAKYLSEYEQAAVELSHDGKVKLINELLMYQRHLAQIKKYQAQQNMPATKTKRRNFYMSILRSNARWKAKDFKGMTFEQIEEKFIPVWEKMQDFVPMNFKLESERLKRPGIQWDKERSKKLKTTKASGTEPSQEQQSKNPKELSEEELKKMMEEDLDKLWGLVNETCSTTEVIDEKAKELWVELKRLYEPDSRDPLWALQRLSVPTADVYIAKKLATVEDFALLHEDKIYSESKTCVCYI